MTTYQIVRHRPDYCEITDANVGSSATVLPMTYRNPKLAQKLADLRTKEDYENFGDDWYTVIVTGTSAYGHALASFLAATLADADEMPF
jgi:hypothetical protein